MYCTLSLPHAAHFTPFAQHASSTSILFPATPVAPNTMIPYFLRCIPWAYMHSSIKPATTDGRICFSVLNLSCWLLLSDHEQEPGLKRQCTKTHLSDCGAGVSSMAGTARPSSACSLSAGWLDEMFLDIRRYPSAIASSARLCAALPSILKRCCSGLAR